MIVNAVLQIVSVVFPTASQMHKLDAIYVTVSLTLYNVVLFYINNHVVYFSLIHKNE